LVCRHFALIWPNRCVPRLLSSLSWSGIIAREFESIRCGIWRWSGPWRFWLHGKVILVIFGLQFLLLKLKKKRSGPLDSRTILSALAVVLKRQDWKSLSWCDWEFKSWLELWCYFCCHTTCELFEQSFNVQKSCLGYR
jgi:hypothetical protein